MRIHAVPLLAVCAWAELRLMHFGCNTSGPENTTQLQELARYAMPILEFRQSCCGRGPWNDSETILEEQAEALYEESKGERKAWVYRNANAGSMFRLQRAAMEDPSMDYLFLGNASIDDSYNISWRSFNFSVPDARQFYLDVIVAEAAAESNTAGVFFDGVDGVCGDHTMPERERFFNDTIEVFRAACEMLRAHGKGCILSAVNTFEGLDVTGDVGCPVYEESMIDIMGSTPWYRYYQHWMNGFVGHQHGSFSSEICAAMTSNLVREGALGIPSVIRAPSDPSKYQSADLDLALATFLIGATEDSTFGWGSCWFDECWHWQEIYNRDFGTPLELATVSADGMRFSRRWSGVLVSVDCTNGASTLQFQSSEVV